MLNQIDSNSIKSSIITSIMLFTINKKSGVYFFLFTFAFFLFLSSYQTTFAQGTTSSQHQIRVQDTVYSQFIPLYGTFSVQIEYSIPLEIHAPERINAGDAFDMLVTVNNPGMITTTFTQDDDVLGISGNELRIGEEKTIEIPESWVGQVFAMPSIYLQPTVTGPATITPENLIFDSETTKQFQVFVDDDIATFDSIKLQLITTVKMKNGGNLNLGITKIPLGEHTSDMQAMPIAKQIQLHKSIPVNLHLQVKQGDLAEHVKVKTILNDSLQMPVSMSTNSVDVYVDGVPQTKIVPNVWSEDIFVGNGEHNFQARFAETRDSNNIAIVYKSADSAIQTITIFSNETSSSIQLQCTSDNDVIKDGKCVPQDEFGFGGGGCLIATAAYGTEMAPQVQFLREIRDNTVLSTSSGAAFMNGFNQFYYSFSPAIADIERENPMFQEVVRAFITPMISTLSIMTLAEDGSEIEVIGLGISVIALNLGMYVATPAFAAFMINQKIRILKFEIKQA